MVVVTCLYTYVILSNSNKTNENVSSTCQTAIYLCVDLQNVFVILVELRWFNVQLVIDAFQKLNFLYIHVCSSDSAAPDGTLEEIIWVSSRFFVKFDTQVKRGSKQSKHVVHGQMQLGCGDKVVEVYHRNDVCVHAEWGHVIQKPVDELGDG